jgi:integrase
MNDDAMKELRRQAERLNDALQKLSGDHTSMSFSDFAKNYLLLKMDRPTLRTSSKQSFSIQVNNHLIPAFGSMPIDTITNADWLRWVMKIKNMNKPTLTRFFNARKALAEILIAAKDEGHLSKLPKLDNPDQPVSAGRALEDKEIFSIIFHAKRPFRFIFYVLWKMGCRPREILQWEWSMIKFNEPAKTWIDIPARISKTGRQRQIPINPEVSHVLHGRFTVGNGSQFVFPNPLDISTPHLNYNGAWKRACARAKVSAVPYDLRRTFITRCAAEGKPLIYVAKALDTSTKMIENIYSKQQVDVMEKIIK